MEAIRSETATAKAERERMAEAAKAYGEMPSRKTVKAEAACCLARSSPEGEAAAKKAMKTKAEAAASRTWKERKPRP